MSTISSKRARAEFLLTIPPHFSAGVKTNYERREVTKPLGFLVQPFGRFYYLLPIY